MDAHIQSQHFVVQIYCPQAREENNKLTSHCNSLLSLNWRNARQKFKWFIIQTCVWLASCALQIRWTMFVLLYCPVPPCFRISIHCIWYIACTRTMYVHFTCSITFIEGRIRIILNIRFCMRIALSSGRLVVEDPSLNLVTSQSPSHFGNIIKMQNLPPDTSH